jgi:hypothetical protein
MNKPAQEIETADDKAALGPALQQAFRHAARHLDELTDGRVSAATTPEELRTRFDRPLTDCGVEPATVIDDIASDAAGGVVGSAGGRFFGWVIGGCVPAALAADWLVSAWDQNAAIYACRRTDHVAANDQPRIGAVSQSPSQPHECGP